MLGRWMAACLFACLAGQARADIDPPPAPTTPPPDRPALSIWRFDSDGRALHLQSGLVCPVTYRGYQRTAMKGYGAFGLDVGCNYQGKVADITVYVTRRDGTSVDDAMAKAKQEFLQIRAEMHPQPISETHPTNGGLAWDLALYAMDSGDRDAIWIADLHGWTLEYRVTYRPDAEAQTLADLDDLSGRVLASAGAQLALCARTPPPSRPGRLITDSKEIESAGMMTAILGGALLAAAEDGKASDAPKAITWCADQPIPNERLNLLFWRGVFADGADAQADEITGMTMNAPPTMVIDSDELANLVDSQKGHAPKWVARIADAEMTRVYGYFTGRPTPEAVGALFFDVLNGKAQPVTSYGVKGQSITIGLPPQK